MRFHVVGYTIWHITEFSLVNYWPEKNDNITQAIRIYFTAYKNILTSQLINTINHLVEFKFYYWQKQKENTSYNLFYGLLMKLFNCNHLTNTNLTTLFSSVSLITNQIRITTLTIKIHSKISLPVEYFTWYKPTIQAKKKRLEKHNPVPAALSLYTGACGRMTDERLRILSPARHPVHPAPSSSPHTPAKEDTHMYF